MFERVIGGLKSDVRFLKHSINEPYRANTEECIAIWKDEIREFKQAISILKKAGEQSQK